MRQIIFPLILGAGGVAILLYLGVWQIQRLAWKEGVLAEIDARLAADPISLPANPDPDDNYTAVTFSGVALGDELHVLVSGTAGGTGYRAISAFETSDGRRILLDQGLLSLERKDAPHDPKPVQITGNLIWPDDLNDNTPDPDLERNIWFARQLDEMSAVLNTEPLMVVAREMTPADPRLTLLPVDSAGIKNDHREYAITWFLMAAVWAAMTAYLMRRTLNPKDA